MVYDNKIEINCRTLKKKAKNRNTFRSYAFVSFAIFLLSYILIAYYADKLDAQIIVLLVIIAFISLISFMYSNSKLRSTNFSLKEWIIYDAQNLKNSIIEMDTESISKKVYELSKNFVNYGKTQNDDFNFNKISIKSKETLGNIMDSIYPTSIQKNENGEYVIYTEESRDNLNKIITNLDNLTLCIINENFLDYEFDGTGLLHVGTDINSIKTVSYLVKSANSIKNIYKTSSSFNYIINSMMIAIIIFLPNIYFDVLSVKDILYISVTAALGMGYAKSKN